MKKIFYVIFSIIPSFIFGQGDSINAINEIKIFQKELNDSFKDPKQSPLDQAQLKKFKKHDFFPIDLIYRVKATLELTDGTPFLPLKTSTERHAEYRRYGYLHFFLKGKSYKLSVFQSADLLKKKLYANFLFFPFTDQSTGGKTYGGGRYIELQIPVSGNEIIIDFNKAYNPYCAYSSKYSCPLVPSENALPIEIPAGVKYRSK